MLFLVLLFVLLGTFVVMVVRRRHLGRLGSFATLIATIMLMLWMQDSGLLPGTSGPLSDTRPKTQLDIR